VRTPKIRSEDAKRNILHALRAIDQMSVPGLFGTLTLDFKDGRLGDRQIFEVPLEPESDDRAKVQMNCSGRTDQEIEAVLESIFSKWP